MQSVCGPVGALDDRLMYNTKTSHPASPTGSGGSLTDEACDSPFVDHAAAVERAKCYAVQRDILERRVADSEFEIGDCSNKIRLVRRLGGGTYGEVYLGESVDTGDSVAVKVELNGNWHGGSIREQLLHEGSVYQKLAGGPGIPSIRWFGMHGSDYSAMAMELLGPTLYGIWAATGERFTIKTLLMIIDQTVETVGHVHRSGFVHRDISPSNFLLNTTPAADRIQLIDFGQAKRVGGASSFLVLPRNSSRHRSSIARPVIGTPRFASIWSHAGCDAAYRDDMESLGYLWIYLARGRLPWQGIRDCCGMAKIAKIGQLKAKISVEELCAGLPEAFATYMKYIRFLRPSDLPDHDGIRYLFRSLADQLDVGVYDWQFDWCSNNTEMVHSFTVEKKYFFPSSTVADIRHSLLSDSTSASAYVGEVDDSNSVTSVSK